MQITTQNGLPIIIRQWLNKRTLKDETINRFNLWWNGYELVIPIYDKNNIFLFNKYRRDPYLKDTDKSKYRYEKGSESTLYNTETLKDIKDNELLFITEGELDTITLENVGIRAISSTGGVGTFKEEWIDGLKDINNIVICFDNDSAGIKGIMKVLRLLPNAKVIFLPKKYGKDITDYFKENNKEDFLKINRYSFNIPSELESLLEKKLIRKKIKEIKQSCNSLLDKRRNNIDTNSFEFMNHLNEYLLDRYKYYKQVEKKPKFIPHEGSNDLIQIAKSIPITKILNFKNNYTECPFHLDKTPSMFYNDESNKYPNTVKCFSCGFMGDSIDLVMKMEGITFQEAIKYLTNK